MVVVVVSVPAVIRSVITRQSPSSAERKREGAEGSFVDLTPMSPFSYLF